MSEQISDTPELLPAAEPATTPSSPLLSNVPSAPSTPAGTGMSRNTKTIIAVVAGVVLFSLCACVAIVCLLGAVGNRTFVGSTEVISDQVMQESGALGDYTAPSGYTVRGLTKLAGFSILELAPADGEGHIYMMSFPRGVKLSQQEMEQRLLSLTGSVKCDDGQELRTTGTLVRTVRGQEITFVTSQATSSGDETYNTMTGVYDGSDGPVFLVISATEHNWDQAEIDRFLASIR
jgi:hypothetical protein